MKILESIDNYINEVATTTTTTLSQGYHQNKIGKKKPIQRKSFKEVIKEKELQERQNPIKGGVGDNLEPNEVDKNELEMGIKVEMEHIGKNKDLSMEQKKKIAQDIALDHLKEKKNYYSLLKKYVEKD